MISNPVFFYIASFILIIFAIITIFAKNIIYSLLASIMTFLASSIIFYILGSEYNAIVQAAIYCLAVPVIIGLSIMFTTHKKEPLKHKTIPYITILSSIIFVMASVYLIMISLVMLPDTFNIMEPAQINSREVILAFSKGIFSNYVWGFELVSLLLTIVIAGLSLFNKRREM